MYRLNYEYIYTRMPEQMMNGIIKNKLSEGF